MNRHTAQPRPDVDDLIRHIKGLVRLRESLRDVGASHAEIEDRSAEIHRLQRRLADRVRRQLRSDSAN
jgi:hypothetical protein